MNYGVLVNENLQPLDLECLSGDANISSRLPTWFLSSSLVRSSALDFSSNPAYFCIELLCLHLNLSLAFVWSAYKNWIFLHIILISISWIMIQLFDLEIARNTSLSLKFRFWIKRLQTNMIWHWIIYSEKHISHPGIEHTVYEMLDNKLWNKRNTICLIYFF